MAVGVALIPTKSWCERFFQLNRQLAAGRSETLVLDQTHLPHLTLYQTAMAEQLVPQVCDQLRRLTPPASLTTTRIEPGNPVADGDTTPWLGITLSSQLYLLHQQVSGIFCSLPSVPQDKQVHFSESQITEDCFRFVASYPEKAKQGRYSPHITIGFGKQEDITDIPMGLEAAILEIDYLLFGQLGHFCSMGNMDYLRLPIHTSH